MDLLGALFALALVVFGGLSLAALIAAANNVVLIKRSLKEFKRKSNGLPMLEAPSLISGHLLTVVFKEHMCEEVDRLHKKHGNTFGFLYREKHAVCTIDLDLIKRILLDNPNKNINRLKLSVPIKEYNESIVFAEDEQWRRIRRAVGPALRSQKFKTPNVVEEIEGSIEKLVSGIEARLEGRDAVEVDIDNLMHRYSLNLVFSCLYKQYNLIDFKAQTDKRVDLSDSGLAANQSNWLICLGMTFPVLRSTLDWLIWNFHPQGKFRREVIGFVEAQTKLSFEARKHLEQVARAATISKQTGSPDGEADEVNNEKFKLFDGTEFRRNLVDDLADSFFDGKITKNEYFNTSAFLLNAADKTSADALARTIYYLSINKQVQEKTRAAVLAEGPSAEYLSWTLNEAMRLCPPAPIGSSRVVKEEMATSDHSGTVPKGALVITPLYTIHRLPAYWGDDADEFKPERWANAKDFHPCQYMPFGLGPRACPGKEFALFEMKKLLSVLLARYKFEGRETEQRFNSPLLVFLINDKPNRVKVSRV